MISFSIYRQTGKFFPGKGTQPEDSGKYLKPGKKASLVPRIGYDCRCKDKTVSRLFYRTKRKKAKKVYVRSAPYAP
jgi:hypothetical protein